MARIVPKVLRSTWECARSSILFIRFPRWASGPVVVLVDHALVEAEMVIPWVAVALARGQVRGIQHGLCGGLCGRRRGQLHGVIENIWKLRCPWWESVFARTSLRGGDRGGEGMVIRGLWTVIELVASAGMEDWRQTGSPNLLFAHRRGRQIHCHRVDLGVGDRVMAAVECCCPAQWEKAITGSQWTGAL